MPTLWQRAPTHLKDPRRKQKRLLCQHRCLVLALVAGGRLALLGPALVAGPTRGRRATCLALQAAKDPYTTLGVAVGASKDQIRKRFRSLAQTEHPDVKPKDPLAGERFQEITTAYKRLMQEEPYGSSASDSYSSYRSSPSPGSSPSAGPDFSRFRSGAGEEPSGTGYFLLGAAFLAAGVVIFITLQKVYCLLDPGEVICLDI
mmetsp:Transcript_40237/g.127954  ORF Transcript_40237/g.127954 Transcript_40237/m.127954 type:complete len:203 (-) Transcript_40237:67-675(-)